MEETESEIRKRSVRKQRLGLLYEGLRWALVIWLLWPLLGLARGSISVGRVVLGIALFVIFSGKLFYDTMISEFIRQKRPSLKQDMIGILGMILGVLLIVGFVVVMVGLLLARWQESAAEGMGGGM
jgi:predicted membrane-bound spermidine synthase